ncbi:MAG: MBL fold metallo-hydrolase [Pseudomonadota bacterium]|nr:MBL fold metallo-hydrolase [Pseudomonadota bacterium]
MIRRLLWTVFALLLLAPGLAVAEVGAPPADGLRVILCGTSGPLPIRDRAKACVAVQVGERLYLVDIGPEATKNLMLWRLPLANLRAVFITHLHSDHIGGLGEVNMQSWVAGRPAPLKLVGPKGVEDLAAGFNQAYGADHGYRRAHHEHGDVKLPIALGLLSPDTVTLPSDADARGVRSKLVLTDGDLMVTAILVDHAPVAPAFAYRFDYKGRSVVVSGDTRKSLPLAAAAKGADLLLHEAQNAAMTRMMSAGLSQMGQPRIASIMADTLTYHTTPVEAEEVAKAAEVKALVLTHLTQAGLPFYKPEVFTRGMDAVGGPPWTLAKDGMVIDLPTGSAEIKYGQY